MANEYPHDNIFSPRQADECKRCQQRLGALSELLEKAARTGLDVGPAVDEMNRKAERIQGYLNEFFNRPGA